MKSIVFLMLVIIISSCQNRKPNENQIARRIGALDPAIVTKVKLDESSSKTFPGTLVFTAAENGSAAIVLNTLPNYYNGLDTIFKYFTQGNVSVVDIGGESDLAIMPKHLFDKGLISSNALAAYGLSVSKSGDIVIARVKKGQNALQYKLLSSLNPQKLNGAKCIIRALNSYQDTIIYRYEISGNIFYLSNEEKEVITDGAVDSRGNRPPVLNTDGLYIVKVPNELFPETPGMSGASVSVNIDGVEYFFGMFIRRFQLESVLKDNTTLTSTTMILQPVLEEDLNF